MTVPGRAATRTGPARAPRYPRRVGAQWLTRPGPLLTAAGLAEAARALGVPAIVLAHPDAGDRSARVGAAARRAFEQAGIGHALVELRPGEPVEMGMGEGQVDPTRWPST